MSRISNAYICCWTGVLLLAMFCCGVLEVQAEPADIVSGRISFAPLVDVRVIYDDNIYLQQSAAKSSVVSQIMPQLKVTIDNQINQTSFGYAGTFYGYQNSSSDNRLDHLLFAKVHHEMMRNLTFDIDGGYQMAHEQRGAFYLIGPESTLLEPDQFNVKQANGRLTLGSQDSKGRLEIEGSQKRLSFVTRPNVTADRNFNRTEGKAIFVRNISVKTAITVEGSYATIDYVSELEGTDSRDSVDQRYLAGMRWQLSQLSEGEINLGLRVRSFAADTRSDAYAMDWRVALNWTPLEALIFNIESQVQFDESAGSSDYVISKDLALGVGYSVSQRHSISASLAGAYKTYPPSSEHDYVVTSSLQSNYRVSKWLSIGLGYKNIRQISNRTGFDFSNNNVFLGFSVSM